MSFLYSVEIFLVPLDFNYMERIPWKSVRTINCLVTCILPNIYFVFSRLKKLVYVFEQLEGEKMMIEFSFLGNLSL